MTIQTSFGGLSLLSWFWCGSVLRVVILRIIVMTQTLLNGQTWCVTTNDY